MKKYFEHIKSLDQLHDYLMQCRIRGEEVQSIDISQTAHREFFRHIHDGLSLIKTYAEIKHPNTTYDPKMKFTYSGIPLVVRQ